MLDYRILGRGRVTYDTLMVDPTVPLADQAHNLSEDLLQVEYSNGVVLDVGWYPDSSPDGEFWVTVVLDSNWSNPWFDRNCTDYEQLIRLISTGAKVAEWLGRGDHPLPIGLYIDNTEGILTPPSTGVLSALLALDGDKNTLVYLESSAGTSLMVGGGNNGRYLVNSLVDPVTQQNHVLTDRTARGAVIELCCGGQAAEFPAHWCVDLGLVLDAASHFCSTGGMAPGLSWEEEG